VAADTLRNMHLGPDRLEASLRAFTSGRGEIPMRLLDGFSRAGAVRLTGVLLATVAVAACCVGVSSAAAPGVIRTIPVGEHPYAVSSDGTHVWVTHPGEGTVSEIEASSGTVIRTIHVGSRPLGVSSDGTHVWVTHPGEGTVSEIEASSGTVIRTINVGAPTGVSSDGTHVWVTNEVEGMVREIEASSGTVVRTIHLGGLPTDVSSDGTHVWVTNINTDRVSEIQASSGTVVRTIYVGAPTGVSSDGTHVWVAACNDAGERVGAEKCGRVSEIEASSGTVVRTIHLGSIGEVPGGVSSDGTHVWVANEREDTVSEIEASSGTVVRTIHVGSRPLGVSSDGTHVWVTNLEADTVSEIEASSGSPSGRFSALPASVNQNTGALTFKGTVSHAGTFSWLIAFQNGRFGVFTASTKKCKKGQVKLTGECRPALVIYAKGSRTVAAAGSFSFTVTPTASALKALQDALKHGGLPVTATLTFQSALGGSPTSHTQSLTINLKKKK
jgi:YVTN family beta-propeller protein